MKPYITAELDISGFLEFYQQYNLAMNLDGVPELQQKYNLEGM